MAEYGLVDIQPLTATLAELENSTSSAGDVITSAHTALEELAHPTLVDFNFPVKRDAAKVAITVLLDLLSGGLATSLRLVASCAATAFKQATTDISPDNNVPEVSKNTLSQVDAWLPQNTLHQFRYLNIYGLADAMREQPNLSSMLFYVDPEDWCYTAPDDMSVYKVLTRTIIFMKELAQAEEDKWVYGALILASELADTIEGHIAPDLQQMRDALESNELQRVAILMADNSAYETAYLATINQMKETLSRVDSFMGQLQQLLEFYGKLACVLRDTGITVAAALAKYAEAHQIDF